MAEFSAPFAGTGGKIVNDSQQRAYYSHLGDGIINAWDNDQLRLVADGTSVLSLRPGEAKVQGLYYFNQDPKTFNVAQLGTQPAAGQSRIDVLVWRLSGADPKGITAEVVTGVPATNPARPTLPGAPVLPYGGGAADRGFFSWRWNGTGLNQPNLVDERTWIGPDLYLAPAAALPAQAHLGTTAYRGTEVWYRRLVTATNGTLVPGWTWVSPAGIARRSVGAQAYDLIAANSMTEVVKLTGKYPPGNYQVTFQAVASKASSGDAIMTAQVPGMADTPVTVRGNNVTVEQQPRQLFSFTGLLAHGGGDMSVPCALRFSAGGAVWAQGTQVTVARAA